jgi:hypothetical protein
MPSRKLAGPDRGGGRARRAVETTIRNRIVKLIQARGWMVRVRSATAHSHIVGDPDLYGCADGLHFEIEVKIPGRFPTQIQEERLKQWRRAGSIAIWGSDAEAVFRQLEEEVLACRSK